ncbi:MAG: T9SS type A sorting domain-containing protein, partial [Bacteroidota bacterium]
IQINNVTDFAKAKSIRIFNLLGECVLIRDFEGNSDFTISYLPRGIYYISVLDRNKMTRMKYVKY